MDKIVNSPHQFCPVESRTPSLQDIQPKHTEVIFVTIGGQKLRIEADLDLVFESKRGQYQIGTTRAFYDNQRNRRLEVTTIDIEWYIITTSHFSAKADIDSSHFDWSLQIITDDSINTVGATLQALIDSSISSSSTTRSDSLGLEYPEVSPQAPCEILVDRVVVRSVSQYMLKDSGYVVEFSIYRQWIGYDTTPPPKLFCAVTLGSQTWDYEMLSIEGQTGERQWDPQLRTFFPDRTGEGTGFYDFTDSVRHVQKYLHDAALDSA